MPTGRKQRRRQVNFRASWAATDAIDQLAEDEGILDADGKPNRSEMIRILLAYAMRDWRKGWRP